MIDLRDHFKFGISPSMLHPASFEDDYEHLAAISRCCTYDEYESFESFLPDDPQIRKTEITMMKAAGKTFHYNTPLIFQLDGPYNPGSDNPQYRENAVELLKRHLEYAAEAESPLIVITGCPDQGAEKRPVLFDRFDEYFCRAAQLAKPLGIRLVIEPIERECFKGLLLGPTCECAGVVERARAKGHENVGLMLDVMHLPLMGETFDEALELSMKAGLYHIHMGDTVTQEGNPFYGHMHPPIGVQGGFVSQKELTRQFVKLLECGYLTSKPSQDIRPTISLEVRPYPGVSERTSARVCFEKVRSAFDAALLEFLNSNPH